MIGAQTDLGLIVSLVTAQVSSAVGIYVTKLAHAALEAREFIRAIVSVGHDRTVVRRDPLGTGTPISVGQPLRRIAFGWIRLRIGRTAQWMGDTARREVDGNSHVVTTPAVGRYPASNLGRDGHCA